MHGFNCALFHTEQIILFILFGKQIMVVCDSVIHQFENLIIDNDVVGDSKMLSFAILNFCID